VAYLLLFFLIISFSADSHAWGLGEAQTSPSLRASNLQIKIIFVGFDRRMIDVDYMSWLLPSHEPRWETQVNLTFAYTFQFTANSFAQSLTSYLSSIQEEEERYNPFLEKEVRNYFYDANSVEEWLYNNRESYGGLVESGYTAIVANLEYLPNPHYYRIRYHDVDFGGEFGAYYRNYWMVGWGGHYRFYYIDMSAGPHGEPYEHQPLWRFKPEDGRYDVLWLTTYLSQVIEEITWNLFAPEPLYLPPLSDRYRIEVFVFDDSTGVDVYRSLNAQIVKKAFEELVPYAAWEVETAFETISKYPELYQVLQSSFDTEDNAYALQPVQNYIEAHLSNFIQPSPGVVVIPAFAFILREDRGMGPLEKWEVYPIAGIAPPKAAYAFLRATRVKEEKIGLTQTVVHELGHLMGLRHPHQYGATGAFVASPMSYTQNEYTFSVFDRDLVARTHADLLIAELESDIHEVERALEIRKASANIKGMLDEVKRIRDDSLQAYSSMDYYSALREAKKAVENAKKLLDEVKKLTTLTEELDRLSREAEASRNLIVELNNEVDRLVNEVSNWRIITIALIIGLVALSFLTVYFARRKKMPTPLIQRAPPGKFCWKCGSAIPPASAYCPECGVKQT
jgi:hypothetical protein